jgi:hypothetical protein
VKISELELRKRTLNSESVSFTNGFECEIYSFEENIDAGCFSPDNWDIVMRTYIKKRSSL